MKLVDSAGTEIEKTKTGKEMEKPLKQTRKSPYAHRRDFSVISLLGHEPLQEYYFNLYDAFKVSVPGQYALTLSLNLWKDDGKGNLTPITMPPVTIKVQLDPARKGKE